jgi:hypothetical protein
MFPVAASAALQVSNPNLWANAVRELQELEAEIIRHARDALTNAIRCGEILSQVRETLKHGEFLEWIQEFAPFSRRSAYNYIRLFDNKDDLKLANVANLSDAYSALLAAPIIESGEPQKLHEPNFHSQAVRLRQNLIGLFNHYLQRRPLNHWHTEEVYDLLCSLRPLTEICTQLELELGTRNDVPATYRSPDAA